MTVFRDDLVVLLPELRAMARYLFSVTSEF